MNILSNLANVLTGRHIEDSESELSPDEVAAAEKKERIAFHRAKVRCGPVKFSFPTAGQLRREKQRALKRESRKAFKGEVLTYFERQRVASYLRPHLQTVGLLPFVDGHEAPLHDQITSTAWILQRYGVEVVNESGEGVGHVSFRKGDVLDGLRNAARFYEAATGMIVRIPADYVPAIVLDEGDA